MRYLTMLVIVVLSIYCFWLRHVDKHNDKFVSDLTDQVGELTQQKALMESRISSALKKEGYVLVFDKKSGYAVVKRSK